MDMPGSMPMPLYDVLPDAMDPLGKCAGLRPSCMGVGPNEDGWNPEWGLDVGDDDAGLGIPLFVRDGWDGRININIRWAFLDTAYARYIHPHPPLPHGILLLLLLLLLHERLLCRYSRPLVHIHHTDTPAHTLRLTPSWHLSAHATSSRSGGMRCRRGRRPLYRRVPATLHHPLHLPLPLPLYIHPSLLLLRRKHLPRGRSRCSYGTRSWHGHGRHEWRIGR